MESNPTNSRISRRPEPRRVARLCPVASYRHAVNRDDGRLARSTRSGCGRDRGRLWGRHARAGQDVGGRACRGSHHAIRVGGLVAVRVGVVGDSRGGRVGAGHVGVFLDVVRDVFVDVVAWGEGGEGEGGKGR